MAKSTSKTIPIDLDLVRIDGDTQPRAKIDTQAVAEYADRIEAGDELPPIDVYCDGTDYWLADGFHRWHAHSRLLRNQITCTVHKGTVEDARWHAIGANQTHGLRRTNEDKEKAVKAALAHPQGKKLSDRAIAEHVGVSNTFVGKVRSQLSTVDSSSTRTGKDGKTRKVPEKKTKVKPAEPDFDAEEEPTPEPYTYEARKYLDEDGQVVGVTAGLGEWWIVARNGHRVKTKAMPPRKSPGECQADLDAYAKQHNWQPVDQDPGQTVKAEAGQPNWKLEHPGDVCPECGSIDTDEDEQGLFCRKCKATIGETHEPDPTSEPLPAHVQKSRAETIFLQIQQLFDDLIKEKGDVIARAMIENAITAIWGE